MATLEEEIRRQRAADALALLEYPEAQAQAEADQPKEAAKPDTADQDLYGDWRKWPSIDPDKVPAGHIDLKPPETPLTIPAPTPESPAGPVNVQTDPETGVPYVIDPSSGQKVLRAELATPADKEAFKPSDVTLPERTVEETLPEVPVKRAQLVKFPEGVPAMMPWRPSAPGFIEGSPNAILNPAAALPTVRRAELIDPDPDAQYLDPEVRRAALAGTAPKAYPAILPTGPKAPGTHTELAPPGRMDLRPDELETIKPAAQQPPPSAVAAVKPVADDWKTWTTVDGTLAEPSVAGAETKTPASAGTLKAEEGNRVDAGALYSYLRGKFADSGLVGYVPSDGARWGIKTGSAAEWAAFGLAVAKQESGLNTRSYNASDPGGSVGLFQFGQGQTQFTGGRNQFDPQASADAFVRSVQHYVGNKGSVANLGETFGSIRRPNEAGQYIGYAQDVAARDSGGTAAQPPKQDWESWATLSPAEVTLSQTQAQVADAAKLNDGLNQSGNLIEYYKTLAANPPKGVNPEVVKQFQANLQKTITEEMQKRFPDMSPEVAWAKAQEHSSLWDIGAEFLHQGQASFAQLAPVFAQRSADKEQLNAFFDNVLPGGSDADKQALLAQIHALPKEQQGAFIAAKIPLPQAGQRGSDPMAVLSAIDHLSDPEFQKKEADKLAAARAFAEKAATEDPRLKGSAGGAIAGAGAAAEQVMAYYGIPIIGAAQAAEETRRAMAKEHPDWDEAKLDSESAFSSLAKVYGNTIAASVMGRGAGLLLKSLTTPWKRAAGQVLAGTLTNLGISGGTTIATNIAENKPSMQGVGESALTGAVQGALFGGLHGVGELRARVTEPVTAPEPAPRVPVTREQRDQMLGLKPVTQEATVGPNVPEPSPLTATSLGTEARRYETGPVVTRGVERTTFTPEELAAQAGELTGRTPEELAAAAERMTPPSNFNQRAAWFLGDEGNQEVQQAQRAQVPSPPTTLEEAIQQQKRAATAAALGETPPRERTSRTTFTTAKGSTYVVHDDGTTTRTKAFRPEHGEAEQGLQERSHQTIYVTPSDAQKLGEIQTKGGPAANLVQASNGQWGLRYREGKDQGKFERRTMVSHTETPAKGLIPVEIWDNGRKVHFGNEITEVRSVTREDATPPPRVGEADPYVSKVANRYTAERMATGELGQIDPSQGQSTEHLVMQGLKMSPQQREGLIDNFTKGKGGDLDTQGAAIRSKEAILSVQSRDASRAAAADPTNLELQAQAKATSDAVTAFYNGPIKKFKRVWSDAGRGLQREIPLDYTTLNGMKEAYLKGKGNGKEAPIELEPKLKQMADAVSKAANAERAAMNNWGKEIEARTRGNPLSDEQVRTRLMEIMKDLPCRT